MRDRKTDEEYARDWAAHERGEHGIEEPTNAEPELEGPRLDIRATAPMRCFVDQCKTPIGNAEPWLIVNTGRGAIFAHLRCLGINTSGNYNDPNYLAHIRRQLLEGVGRGRH